MFGTSPAFFKGAAQANTFYGLGSLALLYNGFPSKPARFSVPLKRCHVKYLLRAKGQGSGESFHDSCISKVSASLLFFSSPGMPKNIHVATRTVTFGKNK